MPAVAVGDKHRHNVSATASNDARPDRLADQVRPVSLASVEHRVRPVKRANPAKHRRRSRQEMRINAKSAHPVRPEIAATTAHLADR
jgi:hypothetical protein